MATPKSFVGQTILSVPRLVFSFDASESVFRFLFLRVQMRELTILRDSVFTAMQSHPDYRFSEPAEAREVIKNLVCLNRLGGAGWCEDALFVAHNEDTLPSCGDKSFWDSVVELASKRGCDLRWFDVTHFLIGFYQNVTIAHDVSQLINRHAQRKADEVKHSLEYELEANNITSPIEQLFYVAWSMSRQAQNPYPNLNELELERFILRPQFPVFSENGEEYLIDFAVRRFDGVAYQKAVHAWEARQDPYSDGNWIGDPFPRESDDAFNLNLKIAIECDSYRYHVQNLEPSQFDYQKRRERCIQQQEWMVFAFSGSEITRDAFRCINEVKNHLRKVIESPCYRPPSDLQRLSSDRNSEGN